MSREGAIMSHFCHLKPTSIEPVLIKLCFEQCTQLTTLLSWSNIFVFRAICESTFHIPCDSRWISSKCQVRRHVLTTNTIILTNSAAFGTCCIPATLYVIIKDYVSKNSQTKCDCCLFTDESSGWSRDIFLNDDFDLSSVIFTDFGIEFQTVDSARSKRMGMQRLLVRITQYDGPIIRERTKYNEQNSVNACLNPRVQLTCMNYSLSVFDSMTSAWCSEMWAAVEKWQSGLL
jgi:hypothetical protein